MKNWLSGVALFAMLSAPASAADMTVEGGWFRSLPGDLPAGGYFTFHNNRAVGVAITGASSPVCGNLMLHHSSNQGGMSGMAMVDKVDVPAHGSVSFAPGGYHLMCMSPRLKPGDVASVTLTLSDGGAISASFAVKDARGK